MMNKYFQYSWTSLFDFDNDSWRSWISVLVTRLKDDKSEISQISGQYSRRNWTLLNVNLSEKPTLNVFNFASKLNFDDDRMHTASKTASVKSTEVPNSKTSKAGQKVRIFSTNLSLHLEVIVNSFKLVELVFSFLSFRFLDEIELSLRAQFCNSSFASWGQVLAKMFRMDSKVISSTCTSLSTVNCVPNWCRKFHFKVPPQVLRVVRYLKWMSWKWRSWILWPPSFSSSWDPPPLLFQSRGA